MIPSDWDSSEATARSRSSSPISFDWTHTDASAEAASPEILATTARLAEITEAFAGPLINPVDSLAPYHPLVVAHERDPSTSIDYFAYFSPPPNMEDPPHLLHQRLQGAVVPGEDETLPYGRGPVLNLADMDPNFIYNGEPASESLRCDDGRNVRKRLWTGSPNPEDALRGRQRPRRESPTPSQRERVGRNGSAYNPWRSSGDRRRRGGGDELFSDGFAPVAVSTPVSSVVPNHYEGSRTGRIRTGSDARRSALPPPQTTSAPNGTPRFASGQYGNEDAASRPESQVPEDRGQEMEIDAAPNADSGDSPKEKSRRDKGKGRAHASGPEQEADAEARPRPQPTDIGWSEQELATARERSLRQVIEQRPWTRTGSLTDSFWARNPQSSAGPSGTQDHRARLFNGAGTSERTLRDAHSSLATRHQDERREDNLPPHHVPVLAYSHSRDEIQRSRRLPSEYRPAPDTRAARHVTQMHEHVSRPSSPAVPQRVPRTRLATRLQSPARHDLSRPDQGRERLREDVGFSSPEPDDARMNDEDDNDPDGQAQESRDWYLEDGEVMPSALECYTVYEDEEPTDVPNGGFPTVYRDDPETALRGMARDWTREIWSDAPGTDVLLDVFNYQYSEDDSFNRRVEDTIRGHIERITGESVFDVVPPEIEEGPRPRARELPTLWAIRGLSLQGTARALERGVWSFPSLTLLTYPRSVTIPSWLFMVEGFLRDDDTKIRAAIMRVLEEDDMRDWIVRMVGSNPEFAGWPLERAVRELMDSLRIETLQLGNGNYISNVIMHSPTRDVREWRRWVAHLRSRRYRSFSIGTGRVRRVTPCPGCKSVGHPSHLCPFPATRGWNGPSPGQGVFGDKRPKEEPTQAPGPARRRNGSNDFSRHGGGGGSYQNGRRDDRHPPHTPSRDGQDNRRFRPWGAPGPNPSRGRGSGPGGNRGRGNGGARGGTRSGNHSGGYGRNDGNSYTDGYNGSHGRGRDGGRNGGYGGGGYDRDSGAGRHRN